jgi:hypothetical protein
MRNASVTCLTPLLAVGVFVSACSSSRPASPPPVVTRILPATDSACTVRDITSASRSAIATGATTVPRTDGRPVAGDDSTWYDVILDVPNLCARRIALRVDTLTARIALDTRLGGLLQVRAGVDIHVGNVDLEIEGLQAQVLLLVYLDDVVFLVDRTLAVVDAHPGIVGSMAGAAAAGTWPGNLLLGRAEDDQGRTLLRAVEESGRILEYTVSGVGEVVARRSAGQVRDLPVLDESRNAAGQTVRRVRDTLGAVVELTLDAATGDVVGIRLISPRP